MISFSFCLDIFDIFDKVAALFIEACRAKGFFLDPEKEVTDSDEIPLKGLIEAIFLEYGFLLHKSGNINGAEFYWRKAGHAGENMIEVHAV